MGWVAEPNDAWERALTPPAANWIRFLRNYGPLPTNGNLFDEHVNVALKRAGVRPIELPTPYVDEMFDALSSGLVRSLLIAGTAGDGKTFHARKLWMKLGGDARAWDRPDKAKRLEPPRNSWRPFGLSQAATVAA